MILPQSYLATLTLLILCVVFWGLWANTYKLARWRFELYYFDWVFGAFLAAVILGLTFGSLGFDGFSIRDDLMIVSKRAWAYALAAGVIFTLGNTFLVAAMAIAGIFMAFPVGIGVSIVVNAAVNYAIRRSGAIMFLLLGSALMIGAVAAVALAYRHLLILRHEQIARAGKAKSTRRPGAGKAIGFAVAGGILLGSFSPLLDGARAGDIGMGPYSMALLFTAGATVSTLMFNLFFMNLPVEGEPLEVPQYFRGPLRNHLLGLAGGALWAAGFVALLVVEAVPQQIGRPLSDGMSQAAALIAAGCGLYIWKEALGADGRVKSLEGLGLLFFAGAIVLLAMIPVFGAK
ncbi:MAG: hypothetical protein C5B51_04330 [Terriglobia bacterium]|nr:MAG: hypothetical protein C5B51_04330 [Terriglobia bacterium]